MKNPVSFTFLICTSCFVVPILIFMIGSFIVSFLNWDYQCDQEIISMAGYLLSGTILNTVYLILGLLLLYIFYQCGVAPDGSNRLCSWYLFVFVDAIFTILFLLDGGLGIYFIFYKKMYDCLQGYESLWVFTIMLIIVDFINGISSICMCCIYKSYFRKNSYIRMNDEN